MVRIRSGSWVSRVTKAFLPGLFIIQLLLFPKIGVWSNRWSGFCLFHAVSPKKSLIYIILMTCSMNSCLSFDGLRHWSINSVFFFSFLQRKIWRFNQRGRNGRSREAASGEWVWEQWWLCEGEWGSWCFFVANVNTKRLDPVFWNYLVFLF
jgi:hypothetical protein